MEIVLRAREDIGGKRERRNNHQNPKNDNSSDKKERRPKYHIRRHKLYDSAKKINKQKNRLRHPVAGNPVFKTQCADKFLRIKPLEEYRRKTVVACPA